MGPDIHGWLLVFSSHWRCRRRDETAEMNNVHYVIQNDSTEHDRHEGPVAETRRLSEFTQCCAELVAALVGAGEWIFLGLTKNDRVAAVRDVCDKYTVNFETIWAPTAGTSC